MVNNKFADKSLCITELCGTDMTSESWWSRQFEYPYTQQFIDKKDIVLDVGSGVIHPFKLWLKKNCKKVYALDNDPALKELKGDKKIEYVNVSVFDMKFKDKFFDKVVCISTLEHFSNFVEMLNVMYKLKKVLKDDGKLILTTDIPISVDKSVPYGAMTIGALRYLVKDSGFKFIGKTDFRPKKDSLKNKKANIRCVCCVLEKRMR